MRLRSPVTTALLLGSVLIAIQVGGDHSQQDDQVAVLAAMNMPTRARLLADLAQVDAGQSESEIVQRMDDSFDRTLAELRPRLMALGGQVTDEYPLLGMIAVKLPRSALEALVQLPMVLRLSPVASGAPSIYRLTNGANHNADFVHDYLGITGEGGVLALLDTGIDLDSDGNGNVHPAFLDEQGNSRVIAAFNINHPGDLEDYLGHGTAVAGIAAARDWNPSNQQADDGFAPGASIVSYKVTSGSNQDSNWRDLTAALEHLFRNARQLDVKVLNISFPGEPSPLHLLEQSMDQLALTRDILIVTSAGNGGNSPLQSYESHSNANGLAVGSVDPDSHKVSRFSSRGPLPGDPQRFWPDISAVGAEVLGPQPNNPEGTSGALSGTSFAAPAVAGTALLIRALDPTLNAFDTKAILLNSVKALNFDNPMFNRNAYGLGMLRTDFAVQSVTAGDLFHGNLQGRDPRATIEIDVTLGETYTATLVWPRYDSNQMTWDNLDLQVIDSEGVTLAVADSPRNLYERVVFRARHSGRYELLVLGIGDLPQPVDWSLAHASERGGGRQAGSFQLQGSSCVGLGENPGDGVILPDMTNGRFGNSRSNLPFAQQPNRMQVAYHGSQVPENLLVSKLAFRRDEASVCAPSYQIELAIRMGHTTTHPANLSRNFADNLFVDGELDLPEPALTTVFERKVIDLPGIHGLPRSDDQFDLVIPLDRPFLTRTGIGKHLILDIQVFWHSAGSQPFELWFDAEENYDLFGRVLNLGDPNATSGSKDAIAPVISLMTDEITSTLPSLVVDSMPQLGETMRVILRHALPGSAGILAHGFSDQSYGGQSLPYALDSLGAPGCMLYNNIDAFLPVFIDANGQALIEYRIPDIPELSGIQFFNQFLIVNPGVNELGIVTTNGGIGRVGG